MSKNLSRHIASFVILGAFLVLALGSTDTDTDTQKVNPKLQVTHYQQANSTMNITVMRLRQILSTRAK